MEASKKWVAVELSPQARRCWIPTTRPAASAHTHTAWVTVRRQLAPLRSTPQHPQWTWNSVDKALSPAYVTAQTVTSRQYCGENDFQFCLCLLDKLCMGEVVISMHRKWATAILLSQFFIPEKPSMRRI